MKYHMQCCMVYKNGTSSKKNNVKLLYYFFPFLQMARIEYYR